MSDEIEDIHKRLQDIEYAIRWIGEAHCTAAYNSLLAVMHDEERKSFVDYWKPKIESIHKDIGDAPTLKKAMKLVIDFCVDISTYASAAKVDTADKAMEIAHSFIKKYSTVALPLKAERQDDVWLVDVDVGALAVKIAKIKIDAKTGDILSYEIPEKK